MKAIQSDSELPAGWDTVFLYDVSQYGRLVCSFSINELGAPQAVRLLKPGPVPRPQDVCHHRGLAHHLAETPAQAAAVNIRYTVRRFIGELK